MYIQKSIKLFLILTLLVTAVSSCKKSKSDFGAALFKESRNKVYKQMDPAAFEGVFKETLNAQLAGSNYKSLIESFYQKNDYEPYYIINFVRGGKLKVPLEYYGRAQEHGLNPELFSYKVLTDLVNRIYSKKEIVNVDQAYREIARAEVLTAVSLLKYTTGLQYGFVNPAKVFPRYFMKTEKPDSNFYNQVFSTKDMDELLRSVQPKDAEYIKFQGALKSGYEAPGLSAGDTRKVIELNLERLRWKNKPSSDRFVYVNIPDYRLKFVDHGKTILGMKVCVGKGPDQVLDDTGNTSHPRLHTTPQLNSEIYNAQVNPIWNIPESIAKNEIYEQAAKDPYYLVNNNINVYSLDGKKLDPEDIDWSKVSKTNMPYKFKQQPGSDNSLGKIKFQFQNASSVYLHDTPAKEAFNLTVRAISHGCVRLEKPLDLAKALYGPGEKLDLIKKNLEEDKPSATDIPLTPRVPVFIDYRTAFTDDAGVIQFRPDVYKLDDLLYNQMKNILSL